MLVRGEWLILAGAWVLGKEEVKEADGGLERRSRWFWYATGLLCCFNRACRLCLGAKSLE